MDHVMVTDFGPILIVPAAGKLLMAKDRRTKAWKRAERYQDALNTIAHLAYESGLTDPSDLFLKNNREVSGRGRGR
jgi:hypothetical protein